MNVSWSFGPCFSTEAEDRIETDRRDAINLSVPSARRP
jgi:hypothetical protein